MHRESKQGERVYGPYKQRNSYRVVIVRADGESRSRKFKSETEADEYADTARGLTSSITMTASVEAYCKALAEQGLRFSSYARVEYHLKKLLQLDKSGGRPLTWTAKRGQSLYDAVQASSAVDTHRNALAAGKSWGRWCVKRGWLRRDPFADVDGVGRRRKGKPQMRIDEARILTDCMLLACAASKMFGRLRPEPVAVLACFLLGPRASELVLRDVRDLDDDGTLLWIPDSKTETGKRILEIPTLLQPLLRELARDRIGASPLFVRANGDKATRHWLAWWCRKACALAKVPPITPQGFRGTHGSIAKRGGASGHVVQEQLGHASIVQTEGGSYVQREAVQAADVRAVELRIVRGGKA